MFHFAKSPDVKEINPGFALDNNDSIMYLHVSIVITVCHILSHLRGCAYIMSSLGGYLPKLIQLIT